MRFETQEDLKRERLIMDKIDINAIKLGDNELDFQIPGKAYIEIKTANCPHDKVPFYLVSLIKLAKMQEYSKKLPTYLFIQWSDKLTFINFKNMRGEVKPNGRTPRNGASNDIELMLHVDPKLFKTYNK